VEKPKAQEVEAKGKADAPEKAKAEAEPVEKPKAQEVEAKGKADAPEKVKAKEADAKAKADAAEKAKAAEADAKAKAEAEAKATETPPAKEPWEKPKGWRLPKDGKWSGDVGDSPFTPTNPKKLGLKEGDVIQYHEGSPDFSPWQHGPELEVPGMNGVHKHDEKLMWEQVAKQQGLPSPNAAKKWLSNNGLSPHHNGGYSVILVPMKLHDGIRHTGGAFELRTGE